MLLFSNAAQNVFLQTAKSLNSESGNEEGNKRDCNIANIDTRTRLRVETRRFEKIAGVNVDNIDASKRSARGKYNAQNKADALTVMLHFER